MEVENMKIKIVLFFTVFVSFTCFAHQTYRRSKLSDFARICRLKYPEGGYVAKEAQNAVRDSVLAGNFFVVENRGKIVFCQEIFLTDKPFAEQENFVDDGFGNESRSYRLQSQNIFNVARNKFYWKPRNRWSTMPLGQIYIYYGQSYIDRRYYFHQFKNLFYKMAFQNIAVQVVKRIRTSGANLVYFFCDDVRWDNLIYVRSFAYIIRWVRVLLGKEIPETITVHHQMYKREGRASDILGYSLFQEG